MMELRPFIDPPRAMGRTYAVDSESHTAPLAEERAVETRSFIEYVVKAYAFTGRTITNGDEETEEVVPIGSYGHVVRHAGETEEWRFQIIGAEPLDDRTYLLTLRPGERARIEDHIDAVEPPRFTLVAQGGVAVPPSTLGGAFAIGPVATVDGGFHISKSESFRLQAGYGYLPSTTGGAPWHAARLTAFFQKSFPLFSWALPYVTVGGGMFINGDGGLSGGAIVAGGIDVAPTRSVHLRVGADFVGNKNHAVFGLFGGLVYRFVER